MHQYKFAILPFNMAPDFMFLERAGNAFFPLFPARLEEVLLLNNIEKTRRKCQKEQWEIFAAS